MSQDVAVSVPSSLTKVGGPTELMRMVLERRFFGADSRLAVGTPATRSDHDLPFFYRVEGYVEIDADRVRELTTNVLAALHAAGSPIVVWIRRERGGRFEIWYGSERSVPHAGQLLHRLMEGNFLGMDLKAVPAQVVRADRASFGRSWATPRAAFIVGIPSERVDTPVETRLDEAFEAITRHEFELVLRCEPVDDGDVDVCVDRLGTVAALAHGQAKRGVSSAVGQSYSESLGLAIGQATAEGQTWSDAVSQNENKRGGAGWGAIIGGAAGALLGAFVGGPMGASVGAQAGGAVGSATGSLVSPGGAQSTSHTEGGSKSDTKSWQRTTGKQFGASLQEQVSFESICYSAELLEEMARLHLARLRKGRALGAWRVSVGLVAPDDATLDTAAHALIGALRGDDSWLEAPRLQRVSEPSITNAIDAIRRFGEVRSSSEIPHPFIPGGEHPSTMLSSLELAHWLRPPARELPGVRIRRPVHFARALPRVSKGSDIELGHLEFWGRRSQSDPVRLPRDGFCQHTMVAGTTGAGKTTTVRNILWQLATGPDPIPFLVLEPAKDEYRDLFESLKRAGKNPLRLTVGGPSVPGSEERLHFNPLAIPKDLIAGQHVEPIKILLRSCFHMQESLPQLLELLVLEAYKAFGIGGEALARPFTGGGVPCLRDLVHGRTTSDERVRRVVQRFGYEKRIEDNLVAALTVRLQSFDVGLKADLFMNGDLDWQDVLRRPTFINISRLPEPDVRRFLTACIFIRLYGERMAERSSPGSGTNPSLRHLLVLEEAHHFVRRAEGHGLAAELVREANMLISHAFAELRAYGQGILVADQAPGELDTSVLRNTNTKICHRLFYEGDCQAMADSMGLDQEQKVELRRLEQGQAVVFGPWHRQAVACQIRRVPDEENATPPT